MLLFLNLVQETQISTPLEATRHHISTQLLVLLHLRAIYFSTFQYETPCIQIKTALNIERYKPSQSANRVQNMDLKKAGCKKQGHCYSKREEARLPFSFYLNESKFQQIFSYVILESSKVQVNSFSQDCRTFQSNQITINELSRSIISTLFLF